MAEDVNINESNIFIDLRGELEKFREKAATASADAADALKCKCENYITLIHSYIKYLDKIIYQYRDLLDRNSGALFSVYDRDKIYYVRNTEGTKEGPFTLIKVIEKFCIEKDQCLALIRQLEQKIEEIKRQSTKFDNALKLNVEAGTKFLVAAEDLIMKYKSHRIK